MEMSLMIEKQNRFRDVDDELGLDQKMEQLKNEYPDRNHNEIEQILLDFNGDYQQVKDSIESEINMNTNHHKYKIDLKDIFQDVSINKSSKPETEYKSETEYEIEINNGLQEQTRNVIESLYNLNDREQAVSYLQQCLPVFKDKLEQNGQRVLENQKNNKIILQNAFIKQSNKIRQLNHLIQVQNTIEKDQQKVEQLNQNLKHKVSHLNIENFNLKLKLQMLDQNKITNNSHSVI